MFTGKLMEWSKETCTLVIFCFPFFSHSLHSVMCPVRGLIHPFKKVLHRVLAQKNHYIMNSMFCIFPGHFAKKVH